MDNYRTLSPLTEYTFSFQGHVEGLSTGSENKFQRSVEDSEYLKTQN